jgi:hypothetical protein
MLSAVAMREASAGHVANEVVIATNDCAAASGAERNH